MEANSIVFRHWDDVVFENRNKLYGAYLLRRAYANRLLAGLCVTVMVLTCILMLPKIFPSKNHIAAPHITRSGFDPMPPPVLETRELPKKTHSQPKSKTRTSQILVTREVPEETRVEVVTHSGSEHTNGTAEIGTVDGPGTLPVIESQPVMEPKIRQFAEVMPHYDGGVEAMMKFLQKKIRYPRVPRQLGIEGTVFVQFVVNGDGSVSDVEILRGFHRDCDQEAIRVISMLPSWKGGSHNGEPVAVRMVLPIKFDLKQ